MNGRGMRNLGARSLSGGIVRQAPRESYRNPLSLIHSCSRPAISSFLGRSFATSSYTVRVHTGNVRGAGTMANVAIELSAGNGASSEKLHIEGGENSPFVDSGVSEFHIEADLDDEPPSELLIGHDESEIGAGWYVEKVEVEQAETGEVWTFPCFNWLGVSDNGGHNGPPCVRLVPQPLEAFEAMDLEDREEGPVSLSVSATCLPRRTQVMQGNKGVVGKFFGYGGEDAYVVAQEQGLHLLGVADGVHAWRKEGIDSGEWSRQFVMALRDAARGEALFHPLDMVDSAFTSVRGAGIQGSSTVCALAVDTETGMLSVANLGDSGFRLLRDGRVLLRSGQQEHIFGCPYQLGHHSASDAPADAQVMTTGLRQGDVLVAGSDGLFDNVDDTSMAELITASLDEASAAKVVANGRNKSQSQGARAAQTMAQRLSSLAFSNSVDKSAVTPYSQAATQEFGMIYSGGKPDDITVVVAIVGEAQDGRHVNPISQAKFGLDHGPADSFHAFI